MADNEFPRLLYKRSDGGNAHDIWGLGTFETLRAANQAEVDGALAKGWTLSPTDKPMTKPIKAAEAKTDA